MSLIFPERPEHAAVIAHHRAYTAGGVNGSALGGTGPAISEHAAVAQTLNATRPVVTTARHLAPHRRKRDLIHKFSLAGAIIATIRKLDRYNGVFSFS